MIVDVSAGMPSRSAETEMGLLQSRVEEADRLREGLRVRVQSLIEQVRRLETASAEAGDDAEAES